MILWIRGGLIVALLLSGCATVEPVQFADIAEANESQKYDFEIIEYIVPGVTVECDAGFCSMSEDDFRTQDSAIEDLLTIKHAYEQQGEAFEHAHNLSIDSLSHCEYAGAKLNEALGYKENQITKLEIMSTIKQLVLVGACGLLLQ